MSFFGKFKQALGFSESDDDEFYISSEDEKSQATHENTSSQNNITQSNHNDSSSTEVPTEIFESVVKIFNESLPDFLKSCVDIDAQRKYIYDALNDDMKKYLSNLSAETRQRCDAKWKEERTRLQTEMAQIKEQCKTIEEQRGEWQKQQLSAERQKRALSERLHDLEKQVATLEAEKEQYDLENKSLLNKLKVSAVVNGDLTELQQEIAELQSQLEEARKADKSGESQALIDAANNTIAQKESEINSLKEQLEQLQEEYNSQEKVDYSEEIKRLNEEINSREIQNQELTNALAQLGEKEKIADVMINDLNAKASEAINQLKQKEAEIEALSQSTGEINQLREKLALANSELEAANSELEDARDAVNTLNEIQDQIEQFEEMRENKETLILNLQSENNKQKEQISKLEEEIASLKKTIEKNLRTHAEIEFNLNKEIDELKSQISVKQVEVVDITDIDQDEILVEIEKTAKQNAKISAIDDSLYDTQWMESTPPPGTATRPAPLTTDEDFGYKSPVIKQMPPENEAQMSLFE